ncbi:MAG TPA: hypothetical protein VH681_11275 [Nitrospiraceae bacterium]
MTLEVRCASLRFRQEDHASTNTDQLRGQFQFRKGGLLYTGVAVVQAMKQASKPQPARLISTMAVKRGITVFKVLIERYRLRRG